MGVGSATATPFLSETFTKVTALECAFHFRTREAFFREAFRVLKPGGRLALADGGAPEGTPAAKPSIPARMALWHFATPVENYYDRNEFKRKLEQVGFVNVQMRSIGHLVHPQHDRYIKMRHAGKSMEEAIVAPMFAAEMEAHAIALGQLGHDHGLSDYQRRQTRQVSLIHVLAALSGARPPTRTLQLLLTLLVAAAA